MAGDETTTELEFTLTKTEAAKLLGVVPRTLQRLHKQGLPHVRRCGRVLYSRRRCVEWHDTPANKPTTGTIKEQP